MRKRIVAGLVALVAIGAGTYLVLKPKTGSVAYHKEQFLQESGPDYRAIEQFIVRCAPKSVVQKFVARRERLVEFHRTQLIRLGYLQRREFAVTNCDPEEIAASLLTTVALTNFLRFGSFDFGSNTIIVVVPNEEIAWWEESIRKLDVPEK